jgi:hypothetical protein
MKQVVIVAPHFPPSNLAAVHRSRLFAMHLPKFGWQVRVLSVAPQYYEEPLDLELEQLVPPWLKVVRTRALPTRPIRLVGDIGVRALWWHYRELGRLIRNEHIDLVYIPIPSNYSAILGPIIYRRYGVPYAIDYIDPWVHPWAGCEVRLSKAWWAFQLGRMLEPMVLRHVRLITAVAPGYYEGALQRSAWLDPSCCVAMPYGAEEADFHFLDEYPRPPTLFDPGDGNRHIVYAGAMLPRAYSTLEAVLQALQCALEQDCDYTSRLRLHFIGTGSVPSDPSSYTVRPWAERFGLADLVREHPARVPYLDVLNHLKHAHGVLILGSSEPHYTASKVFQAVLSRRPVIGLLHAQSTAAAILQEAHAGPVITFDEAQPVRVRVREIAQVFLDVVRDHSDYSPEQVNWKAFQAYSAEAMAHKLATAFDTALDRANRGK